MPGELHFGEKDQGIPMSDVEIIKQKRPEIEVFIYDDAGHGFSLRRARQLHKAKRRHRLEAHDGFSSKHMKIATARQRLEPPLLDHDGVAGAQRIVERHVAVNLLAAGIAGQLDLAL